ncbi:hypothetical protein LTT66_34790 [Nocardia gipuzkoensis]|uniref:hypothetical protein n=1 Tax=Nocardia gipuzkoensis TaxID=2749991 RepID=UPI001E5DE26F|nr:hypothetical protein [Nocardia gipuzkoensis]UGT68262.1 hypothetical protein LTT66_34790 [Nocardia gipuzkoensis]
MSPSTGNDVKPPPVRDGAEQIPGDDSPRDPDVDELALAAEAAEAEAQAAEARAAAARARVRAAEGRRRAHAMSRRTGSAAPDGKPKVSDPAAEPGEPGDDHAADDRSDPHPTGGAQASPSADEDRDATANTAEPESLPRRAQLRDIIAGRLRRRSVMVVGALAVIALALAGSGYTVWHHHEATEKDRRAAEFTAAARQGVVALTTLDFNRAKEDVQRVLDNSTGSFRGDFQARAADFTTVVQQSQVATAGKVNATAIESMTEDSAVVLVAATSQVTNSAGARQEPRAWRLSVTVSRDGDQLKMSKVEFVP